MHRTVIRYVLIACAGLLILGMLTAFVKAVVVKKAITRSEYLFDTGHPREALEEVMRIEPWAVKMPRLEHRLLCCATRCHARLSEFRKAASIAREAVKRTGPSQVPFTRLFDYVRHTMADAFISGESRINPWEGYECLISELKSTGGNDAMIQSLVREMPEDIRPISVTPPVRQQSSRAISQRKELPADPLSGIASSGPYSADPHTRLSEKAVLRGDWDLAIQEAGLALNENQDNARAMLMKSIAEAKGQVCGVVKTASARAYDSTGSTIEDGVELGTFLEISSFKANRTDMLAVSSFSRSDSVISGILIPLNDIEIDTRQLSSLSDDDKSALKQRAILLSSIDKLGSEQAALKAKLNPHADEYAKATAAYNAYFKKSANLAARRESASGDERMKIEDELRKLRAEGARAKREYEAVKDKCKAWNDDFSPSDNPEIQKLQENIDSLNNELRSLQDGRQP